MRRVRGEYLGLFAHLLHIPPAAVDGLYVRDFIALVDWIDRHEAELKKANEAAQGG